MDESAKIVELETEHLNKLMLSVLEIYYILNEGKKAYRFLNSSLDLLTKLNKTVNIQKCIGAHV